MKLALTMAFDRCGRLNFRRPGERRPPVPFYSTNVTKIDRQGERLGRHYNEGFCRHGLRLVPQEPP